MIKSERTKKRKIQNELNILELIETNKITSNQLYCSKNLADNHENSPLHDNDPSNISPDVYVPQHLQNITPCITPTILNEPNVMPEYSENTVNQLPESGFQDAVSIKDFIASWSITFNVPHNAVNNLLKGLKKHKCFKDFPVDSRTLLATPKQTSTKLRSVDPCGTYFHFGLTTGIMKYTPDNMLNVEIVIGIDGLPLFKSSGAQFWPILGYVIVSPPLLKKVFPIGIYFGYEKPKDSNNFLSDFITEAKDLIKNGLIVNQVKRKIIISAYCCDAPAKAFVLKIKSHTGFSSCTRCTIDGQYLNKRVCFPYSKKKCTERTHQAYTNFIDDDFQTSQTLSVLNELPGFDSVKQFSLDYMHLVCLGVMKKLMLLWIQKGPLHVRLNSRKVKELSLSLISMNLGITSDFSRKSRSMNEIHRWKATEFRLFLLYTGPIVLKKIISDECYTNFMALNISMIILLSPDRSSLIPYTKHILDYFVMSFQKIYGKYLLSHNIHALLHLCDDYQQFGPLDNCSSFLFENYMKKIKSLVRKADQPLEQVINRYSEINSINRKESFNLINYNDKSELKHPHNNGPITKNINGQQYYTLIFSQFKINVKFNKDCTILTNNGEVVKCLNIIQVSDEILLIGKKYETLLPFFTDPINSTILEIFILDNLSMNLNCWKLTSIKKKLMVLENDGTLIAMPIIHTIGHNE
ncbi:unnamed protein product [Macrosiphum euphorbiae]|uniref:DUF4806 domain-containing protein n=1 Tax=Macrosiphum euphorbiae TaxID=13131 RepID=A0AAV0VIM8_9HEMI|nr:unnamed protein product [Macrosiphum euphorbiae]